MKKYILISLLISLAFACKKDKETVKSPTATNLEIGTANNKKAIRGRDFHLNADIIAGDRIQDVQVKIIQKTTEAITTPWKFELSWSEYKTAKNTNVHKHFTIPEEAPEGNYDFYFIVLDENGTKLEIKEDFVIIDAANMPVDPEIRDIILKNDVMVYYSDTYVENPLAFKKGDVFVGRASIRQIQGDGVLYTVLVKRKLNYFPETPDNLDMSKVIVVSKIEHTGLAPASKVSTLRQINGVFGGDSIVIGDEKDALGNVITGNKAWEAGQYNLITLYKNTTFNISVYKSIPVTVN